MGHSEFKSSTGESYIFGSVASFLFTFLAIAIIFNFVRKYLFNQSKKISLSQVYSDVFDFFDTVWIFVRLFIGDGEVILDKVVTQLKSYEAPRDIRLGLVHFVYVNKPEDLQIVLNNSSTLAKSEFYRFFKGVVGEGLFTAPVPKWKKHRRLITPVFNTRLLDNFFPVFNEKNTILVNKLKQVCDTNEVTELWDYVGPVALEIICETAMGVDSESNTQEKEKEEFQELVVKVSEEDSLRIYKLWLHPDIIFHFYSKMNGHLKDLEDVRILPMKIIKYKKELLANSKLQNPEILSEPSTKGKLTTFLDTLLQLNEEGAEFSDQELYDEVITMMIGGSETSAITNCFTLLMLAMHPHIQDKVYKEVIAVLGEKDRFITMQDVQNMPFLEQCIKETLRLFPTGPLLLREAGSDFKLSNEFVVQKGATIIVPPIMVHRSEEVYPNPLVWNPDNFSPQAVEKRHRYSFLGFSGGPRGCVGQRYALLSMKVTISMVLKYYKVSTDEKLKDIRLKLDLLLRSVNGYKVNVESRKPKHNSNA